MPVHKDGDAVTHPPHYNASPSGVECIEVVRHMTFNVGSAVKYCWRAGLKSSNAVEDLRKAVFYINDEIERLEKMTTVDSSSVIHAYFLENTKPSVQSDGVERFEDCPRPFRHGDAPK